VHIQITQAFFSAIDSLTVEFIAHQVAIGYGFRGNEVNMEKKWMLTCSSIIISIILDKTFFLSFFVEVEIKLSLKNMELERTH